MLLFIDLRGNKTLCPAAVVLCVLSLLSAPCVVWAKNNPAKPLEGRVEDQDKIRLQRPHEGVVNQSVEILDGQSYDGYLDGSVDQTKLQTGTAQDTLKGLVGGGDFSLRQYKRKTPQSDPGSLKDWEADMESQKWKWQDVTYTLPNYHGYGDDPIEPPRRYTIPKRMYDLDDWKLRQKGVSGQVRFPQTDAQLYPQPNFEAPNFQLPRRFTAPGGSSASSSFGPPMEDEKYIGWDDWYKRVADVLWRTWRQRGSEPGEADLAISVTSGKSITAQMSNATNRSAAFRSSLMKAVESLNGSAALEFPAQSRRRSVSFQSHFSAGVDVKSGASSKRSNDTERVRTRR